MHKRYILYWILNDKLFQTFSFENNICECLQLIQSDLGLLGDAELDAKEKEMLASCWTETLNQISVNGEASF